MLDEKMVSFILIFLISGIAGVGSLLRKNTQLTTYCIMGAIINSGCLGLALFLLFYNRFENDIYLVAGCCIIAGLGGMSAIDFILSIAAKYLSKRTGVKPPNTTNTIEKSEKKND